FDTPRPDVALKRHIPRFRLHDSQEAVNRSGTLITIRVDRADGLKPGTAIRFRGLDVGSIESVDLTDDLQAVLLRARITESADRIARVGTQFWV
ncbi:MlaD family protein, partial [Escherichia coli]|uniref:MlaD family protein n=2 Tax=Gammaproteobacteria TaxID=1236 RepID=UPI0018E12F20